MEQNNKIKVYTSSLSGNLEISVSGMKQTVEATNNRARYYAEQALKYRDEAKKFAENAQYYAEQNSDVSKEDLINLKAELQREIETKQDIDDYALRKELPKNVTELNNDANYVNQSQLLEKIPEQVGNQGKVLVTDGRKTFWSEVNTYKLFDCKLSDYILPYEESKGWALQGTYVYKDAIVGSRYGYSDFYEKCLEEKEAATAIEVAVAENVITMYVHSNGHQYYDISDVEIINTWFETYGSAWFYGIDTENERIFLPRNNYFDQATGDSSEVGESVDAGLPNIKGVIKVADRGSYAPSNPATGAFAKDGTVNVGIAGGNSDSWGGQYSFDASRSNKIYDNSDTVQPNAVKKLLYICVGNTVAGTSWVDVVTQVEDGVKDLEDKTNEGLEALSNASNVLRQTQITNCLLEVPQNIKCEVTNSGFTLKAGSVVVFPNGVDNFEHYTVPNDITIASYGTGSDDFFVMLDANKSNLRNFVIRKATSGTAAPTGEGLWYDTANNIVKYYNSSNELQWTGLSFPFVICSRSSGTITGVKQVFNGFGYIGSTIWADKGIKGLIPNGRNADGTLNNIEFTTSKIRTYTNTTTRNNAYFALSNNDNDWVGRVNEFVVSDDISQSATSRVIYSPILNKNIISGGTDWKWTIVGQWSSETSSPYNITSFQPKLSVHLVDRNELQEVIVITESYVNGTSGYNVYSNGYCEQWGRSSATEGLVTVTLLKAFADINYSVVTTGRYASGNTANAWDYVRNVTATSFGIYQQSAGCMWQACGYIA